MGTFLLMMDKHALETTSFDALFLGTTLNAINVRLDINPVLINNTATKHLLAVN